MHGERVIGRVDVNPATRAELETDPFRCVPQVQGHPLGDAYHSLPWGVVNLCRDGDYYFAQFVHWDANREQAPMPAGDRESDLVCHPSYSEYPEKHHLHRRWVHVPRCGWNMGQGRRRLDASVQQVRLLSDRP